MVLPAPLGPSIPTTSPRRTRERKISDRVQAAEVLVEVLDLEQRACRTSGLMRLHCAGVHAVRLNTDFIRCQAGTTSPLGRKKMMRINDTL